MKLNGSARATRRRLRKGNIRGPPSLRAGAFHRHGEALQAEEELHARIGMEYLLQLYGPMNILSSLILVLLLAGPSLGQGRSTLPMAAQLKEAPLQGYDAPDLGTRLYHKEVYTFQSTDAPLVVYETNGMWFRVTPSSFPRAVWVDGNRVNLNEALSVPENPPYLGKMDEYFKELEERSHVTGCAIALQEIWRPYTGPSFDSERSNMLFGRHLGEVMPVYRQQSGWYEIYNEGIYVSLWIPAKEAALTGVFSEGGEPCTRAFSPESAPVYMFLHSNAYRIGPSSELRPLAFYHAGELVQALAESSNGWLATQINGAEDLVWFPASDATKTVPFPISAFTTKYPPEFHSAPRSDASVLFHLGTNDYIILFEQVSSNSQLWYRTTPDGFIPEAWISADHVKIEPLKPVARADIESEYLTYLRPRYPAVTYSAPSLGSEKILFFGYVKAAFILLLIAFTICFVILYERYVRDNSQTAPSTEGESMKLVKRGRTDLEKNDEPALAPLSPSAPPGMVAPRPHPLEETFIGAMFPAVQKFIASWIRERRGVIQEGTGYNQDILDYQLSQDALDDIDTIKAIKRAERTRELSTIQNDILLGEAGTLSKVQDILRKDKAADEKHSTMETEEGTRRAKNTLERRGYERAGEEKPPQRRLSYKDRLRIAISRETSKEKARLAVLAEERASCLDSISQKRMTSAEMEHHMANVEEVLNREMAKDL